MAKCPIYEAELCWDDDADSEDIGYQIKGIVTFYHCVKCGTIVETLQPTEEEK